jgi:UDP-2-acetamido-2,6-beta-L-arabino-hexul-4-ose reductase
MLKIGITGNNGFIGKNLFLEVESQPKIFKYIYFEKTYFNDVVLLREFVLQCDVIVHLAALSRHPCIGFVLENNVRITKKLISAMQDQNVKPYLIFASSIHDNSDSEYARSKRIENELLSNWARKNNSSYSCLVLNNIYGPFCKPNYASFVATFCYALSRNETPQIIVDKIVELTYIYNLTEFILNKIVKVKLNDNIINEYLKVPSDVEVKVSEVLRLLVNFSLNYTEYKNNPCFINAFQKNLFTTFCFYFEENQQLN